MLSFLLPLLNKVIEVKKHWLFRWVIAVPALTGNVAAIQELGEVLNKIKNFANQNGIALKNPAAPIVEASPKSNAEAVVKLATGYEISIYRVITDEGKVRQVIHFPAATVPADELLYLVAGLDAALKTAANIR